MAALSESSASPSSPTHPQPHMPATPDREPTFSHAATSGEPSLPGGRDGTPSRWIPSLRLKAGQPLLEILGYRARRDLPIRTWAIWRFISSWVLAWPQLVAILVITVLAFTLPSSPHNLHPPPPFFGRTEYDACHSLTVSIIIWFTKLVSQLITDVWFLCRRLKTGAEPIRGTPVIQGCPLDVPTSMNLATFLEPWFVCAWILLQVVFHLVDGKQCYVHAPRVSTMAFIVLALALLYYLPTTGLLILRRFREPRTDSRDDIEIGPLPQRKVDRIDLVYYIPHPPPAAAVPIRPSGPVAGFRRFGHALGTGATANRAEQRPRGNGGWEDTFQRMPHALLRIEKHEAQCGICLEDYTEPPRAMPGSTTASATTQSAGAGAQGAPEPEPLRWLDCGHVFHKGCLDPCLTRGPAKCPTCRTAVKVRPPARK